MATSHDATQKALTDIPLYYPVSNVRMVRGEGIYLYDSEGKSYIDCAAGTFNLSLGYGHPAVISEANEGAIKMAQRATGRRDIITLFRSHVGQTMMTAYLSGNAFRKASFPLTLPGGLHVPDPYCL